MPILHYRRTFVRVTWEQVYCMVRLLVSTVDHFTRRYCATLRPVHDHWPIDEESHNWLPISFQSDVNRVPIQCQYDVNPMSFKSYQSSSTIHSQSDVNSVSIPCQSSANQAPIQHHFDVSPIYQYGVYLVSIQCKANVNQKPISCQSIANIMPFRCQSRQSCANPCQSVADLMSIKCQSNVGHIPIHCLSDSNSVPIRFQSEVNPRLIISHQSIANHIPIFHSMPIY